MQAGRAVPHEVLPPTSLLLEVVDLPLREACAALEKRLPSGGEARAFWGCLGALVESPNRWFKGQGPELSLPDEYNILGSQSRRFLSALAFQLSSARSPDLLFRWFLDAVRPQDGESVGPIEPRANQSVPAPASAPAQVSAGSPSSAAQDTVEDGHGAVYRRETVISKPEMLSTPIELLSLAEVHAKLSEGIKNKEDWVKAYQKTSWKALRRLLVSHPFASAVDLHSDDQPGYGRVLLARIEDDYPASLADDEAAWKAALPKAEVAFWHLLATYSEMFGVSDATPALVSFRNHLASWLAANPRFDSVPAVHVLRCKIAEAEIWQVLLPGFESPGRSAYDRALELLEASPRVLRECGDGVGDNGAVPLAAREIWEAGPAADLVLLTGEARAEALRSHQQSVHAAVEDLLWAIVTAAKSQTVVREYAERLSGFLGILSTPMFKIDDSLLRRFDQAVLELTITALERRFKDCDEDAVFSAFQARMVEIQMPLYPDSVSAQLLVWAYARYLLVRFGVDGAQLRERIEKSFADFRGDARKGWLDLLGKDSLTIKSCSRMEEQVAMLHASLLNKYLSSPSPDSQAAESAAVAGAISASSPLFPPAVHVSMRSSLEPGEVFSGLSQEDFLDEVASMRDDWKYVCIAGTGIRCLELELFEFDSRKAVSTYSNALQEKMDDLDKTLGLLTPVARAAFSFPPTLHRESLYLDILSWRASELKSSFPDSADAILARPANCLVIKARVWSSEDESWQDSVLRVQNMPYTPVITLGHSLEGEGAGGSPPDSFVISLLNFSTGEFAPFSMHDLQAHLFTESLVDQHTGHHSIYLSKSFADASLELIAPDKTRAPLDLDSVDTKYSVDSVTVVFPTDHTVAPVFEEEPTVAYRYRDSSLSYSILGKKIVLTASYHIELDGDTINVSSRVDAKELSSLAELQRALSADLGDTDLRCVQAVSCTITATGVDFFGETMKEDFHITKSFAPARERAFVHPRIFLAADGLYAQFLIDSRLPAKGMEFRCIAFPGEWASCCASPVSPIERRLVTDDRGTCLLIGPGSLPRGVLTSSLSDLDFSSAWGYSRVELRYQVYDTCCATGKGDERAVMFKLEDLFASQPSYQFPQTILEITEEDIRLAAAGPDKAFYLPLSRDDIFVAQMASRPPKRRDIRCVLAGEPSNWPDIASVARRDAFSLLDRQEVTLDTGRMALALTKPLRAGWDYCAYCSLSEICALEGDLDSPVFADECCKLALYRVQAKIGGHSGVGMLPDPSLGLLSLSLPAEKSRLQPTGATAEDGTLEFTFYKLEQDYSDLEYSLFLGADFADFYALYKEAQPVGPGSGSLPIYAGGHVGVTSEFKQLPRPDGLSEREYIRDRKAREASAGFLRFGTSVPRPSLLVNGAPIGQSRSDALKTAEAAARMSAKQERAAMEDMAVSTASVSSRPGMRVGGPMMRHAVLAGAGAMPRMARDAPMDRFVACAAEPESCLQMCEDECCEMDRAVAAMAYTSGAMGGYGRATASAPMAARPRPPMAYIESPHCALRAVTTLSGRDLEGLLHVSAEGGILRVSAELSALRKAAGPKRSRKGVGSAGPAGSASVGPDDDRPILFALLLARDRATRKGAASLKMLPFAAPAPVLGEPPREETLRVYKDIRLVDASQVGEADPSVERTKILAPELRSMLVDSLTARNLSSALTGKLYQAIASWTSSSAAEKAETWSRYGCHELALRVYLSDPAWFPHVHAFYRAKQVPELDAADMYFLTRLLDQLDAHVLSRVVRSLVPALFSLHSGILEPASLPPFEVFCLVQVCRRLRGLQGSRADDLSRALDAQGVSLMAFRELCLEVEGSLASSAVRRALGRYCDQKAMEEKVLKLLLARRKRVEADKEEESLEDHTDDSGSEEHAEGDNDEDSSEIPRPGNLYGSPSDDSSDGSGGFREGRRAFGGAARHPPVYMAGSPVAMMAGPAPRDLLAMSTQILEAAGSGNPDDVLMMESEVGMPIAAMIASQMARRAPARALGAAPDRAEMRRPARKVVEERVAFEALSRITKICADRTYFDASYASGKANDVLDAFWARLITGPDLEAPDFRIPAPVLLSSTPRGAALAISLVFSAVEKLIQEAADEMDVRVYTSLEIRRTLLQAEEPPGAADEAVESSAGSEAQRDASPVSPSLREKIMVRMTFADEQGVPISPAAVPLHKVVVASLNLLNLSTDTLSLTLTAGNYSSETGELVMLSPAKETTLVSLKPTSHAAGCVTSQFYLLPASAAPGRIVSPLLFISEANGSGFFFHRCETLVPSGIDMCLFSRCAARASAVVGEDPRGLEEKLASMAPAEIAEIVDGLESAEEVLAHLRVVPAHRMLAMPLRPLLQRLEQKFPAAGIAASLGHYLACSPLSFAALKACFDVSVSHYREKEGRGVPGAASAADAVDSAKAANTANAAEAADAMRSAAVRQMLAIFVRDTMKGVPGSWVLKESRAPAFSLAPLINQRVHKTAQAPNEDAQAYLADVCLRILFSSLPASPSGVPEFRQAPDRLGLDLTLAYCLLLRDNVEHAGRILQKYSSELQEYLRSQGRRSASPLMPQLLCLSAYMEVLTASTPECPLAAALLQVGSLRADPIAKSTLARFASFLERLRALKPAAGVISGRSAGPGADARAKQSFTAAIQRAEDGRPCLCVTAYPELRRVQVRSYSWADVYGAKDDTGRAKWVHPERRVIAQLGGSAPGSEETRVPVVLPIAGEDRGDGPGCLREHRFLLTDITSSSYIEVTNGFDDLEPDTAKDSRREPHVVCLTATVPTFRCELNRKFGLLTVREGAGRPAGEGARVACPRGRGLRGVYVYVMYSPAGSKSPGEQKFWKDGFTDLLGRFDYASVSTTPLSSVGKFHLYVERDQGDMDVLTVEPPRPGTSEC